MMVKICGITNGEDLRAAVAAGAGAVGFNFYPKSPRYVSEQQARALVAETPAGVLKVGVFVREAPVEMARRIGLDVLQVHGEVGQVAGARIWRAVSVGEDFAPEQVAGIEAEALLVDAPAGEAFGGTGKTFDWRRVRGLGRRIVIAGGLDWTNVGEAIAVAQPWGVDACSRIERAPGKKDHEKMARFIAAALRAV
jgi:phosphoribosylanthranilate isomerase